jgi:hypothetical protein
VGDRAPAAGRISLGSVSRSVPGVPAYDPVVSSKYQSRMVFFNEEVYHVINRSSNESEIIRLTIREADTSIHLVGVGCPNHAVLLDPAISEVSVDDLLRIASEVTSIVVEAFDGESFLIWERQREEGAAEERKKGKWPGIQRRNGGP